MIDDQRTVSEPSHDAGICGDYGAEDEGAAHGSGEDEREGDPEDGADDGAGDGPEDGGSKSAGSSSSLAAPELVHAPEQPARQLLGKRARAGLRESACPPQRFLCRGRSGPSAHT